MSLVWGERAVVFLSVLLVMLVLGFEMSPESQIWVYSTEGLKKIINGTRSCWCCVFSYITNSVTAALRKIRGFQ